MVHADAEHVETAIGHPSAAAPKLGDYRLVHCISGERHTLQRFESGFAGHYWRNIDTSDCLAFSEDMLAYAQRRITKDEYEKRNRARKRARAKLRRTAALG